MNQDLQNVTRGFRYVTETPDTEDDSIASRVLQHLNSALQTKLKERPFLAAMQCNRAIHLATMHLDGGAEFVSSRMVLNTTWRFKDGITLHHSNFGNVFETGNHRAEREKAIG